MQASMMITRTTPMSPLQNRVLYSSSVTVGSSPPTCHQRCGNCNPCKSMLVPIHAPPNSQKHSLPSQNTPDYYPLAWKCECQGHIYSP
ncbi:hypothetical protein GOP47_0030278 [Adiantum capillus-veneris]|nr:hypothetical protein GOP47_0030278 [Adiantum capillus-veneris]